MLAPRRKHQQRLGFRVQVLRAPEHQPAQLLPYGSPPWLARHLEPDAALPEKTREPPQMRALARAVYAFQGDEFAAHHRFPDL